MSPTERPLASAAVHGGLELLRDPRLNKGTAFSAAERDALGLRGLLPPRVFSAEAQVTRNLLDLRRKASDLERYMALAALADRNETLFYRVLLENLEELMPIVYTPTVGEACERYGYIFQRPRGLFVSAADRGRVRELLRNWPEEDVRVVVLTDGSRILGLGDLGAQGMGIPVGKLTLYSACAGVHPRQCLPITLDVGTDNAALRADPMYVGLQQPRLTGEAYDSLLEELVEALFERFPRLLLQFEDFANQHAFRLLERYRERVCCFNDDIQGTAAVTLAGLAGAARITGRPLREQKLLFYGAGAAGLGTADLFVTAALDAGESEESARARCWFFDSHGLVVTSRGDLGPHKRRYAHEHAPLADLAQAVEQLAPSALIGVSGQPRSFTRAVVEALARHNERPVVFALSNPTSKAECTAAEAYAWSEGRALFASGSPFAPVEHAGRTLVPGQCNNAYVFPGLGLGVVASEAGRVVDAMFVAAARRLASLVSEAELARGALYPPLASIRAVSAEVACAVAEVAFERGLSALPRPAEVGALVRAAVYEPRYRALS